jgi:hypothetical protein
VSASVRRIRASSHKQQATSHKLQALKPQATSFKPQATSVKLQAASDKLPDSMSFIKFQAASVMGLDYLLTLNSIVKNVLFLLYANTSGVPKALVFSILVYEILGVFFLKYW